MQNKLVEKMTKEMGEMGEKVGQALKSVKENIEK